MGLNYFFCKSQQISQWIPWTLVHQKQHELNVLTGFPTCGSDRMWPYWLLLSWDLTSTCSSGFVKVLVVKSHPACNKVANQLTIQSDQLSTRHRLITCMQKQYSLFLKAEKSPSKQNDVCQEMWKTNRVMFLLHVKKQTLCYILSIVGCKELVRGSLSNGLLPDVTHCLVGDTHAQKNQLLAPWTACCTLSWHRRLFLLSHMQNGCSGIHKL